MIKSQLMEVLLFGMCLLGLAYVIAFDNRTAMDKCQMVQSYDVCAKNIMR